MADRHRTETFCCWRVGLAQTEALQAGIFQHRANHKLSPKFYGPLQILGKVGQVAYKLQLHDTAQIHHTFHVPQLKPFRGVLPSKPHIPNWLQGVDAHHDFTPIAVLARRMAKKGNAAAVQWLVQWEGHSPEKATWQFVEDLEHKFPAFVQNV